MARSINYFLLLLLIFHLVGIGLFMYFKEAPDLTYVNLFISALFVFISEISINKRSATTVFLLLFLAGFVIELIGVQTGWLFGSYSYETTMGPQVLSTPIVIGATWYAVVLGAANVSLNIGGSLVMKSVIAGLLAVIMDVLIEQVAMRYGLWSWANNRVPLYNYVCWFAFATLFAAIYLRGASQMNRTAIYLFGIWILFFTTLTLT